MTVIATITSSALAELYVEFFFRFIVIMSFIITLLLTVAMFLKLKTRNYLVELLLLGFLIFSLLWMISHFSQVVLVSSELAGLQIGSDLMARSFALMGAIMIFSVAVVKTKLSK